ncbi:MAG: phage exclusion protein Lit family protein [Thermoanaerobaculia bacterium]
MSEDTAEAPESCLAKDLILKAVPERSDDLARLWETYGPQFRAGSDRREFHLAAGVSSLIVFTTRSLRQLWLLGFAGMDAMKALGGVIFCMPYIGRAFDLAFVTQLEGQVDADSAFDKILAAAHDLGERENPNEVPWPTWVPEPEEGRPTEPTGALAFDLTCLATAYTFLHEVQHLIGQADGTAEAGPAEELACDEYARAMLLDQAESYASTAGVPLALVRRKRAMAIALASFFVVWLTPAEAAAGTDTHPALRDRLNALAGGLAPEEDQDLWIFMCCLLASTLRRAGRIPPSIAFSSARELAFALMEKL